MSAVSGSRRRAERAKPSVVGPVHGPRRATTIVVGVLILAVMTALMLWAFGYVSDAPRFTADAGVGIRDQLKAVRAVIGSPWWVPPVILFLILLLGEGFVRLAARLLPGRPRHEWQMPDSELTPEELVERRELEAELDAAEDEEPRRFMLRGSTWFVIGTFLMTAGVPLAADLVTASQVRRIEPVDTRGQMAAIGRSCPALAEDVRAHLERGTPTVDEVGSMRERARIVAASPVKGQECRA